MRSVAKEINLELKKIISTHNKITALKHALRPFSKYKLVGKAIGITVNESWIGIITEYASTADDLLKLAEIQIRFAEAYSRGLEAWENAADIIEELQTYDTDSIEEAEHKVNELNEEARKSIETFEAVMGEIIGLIHEIEPLTRLPNYGYGAKIVRIAEDTKEKMARAKSWYEYQHERLSALLRASI